VAYRPVCGSQCAMATDSPGLDPSVVNALGAAVATSPPTSGGARRSVGAGRGIALLQHDLLGRVEERRTVLRLRRARPARRCHALHSTIDVPLGNRFLTARCVRTARNCCAEHMVSRRFAQIVHKSWRVSQAGRPPVGSTSTYSGSRSSGFSTSSMFTSLNVITRTCLTNRAGRYMSQTQASASRSSK